MVLSATRKERQPQRGLLSSAFQHGSTKAMTQEQKTETLVTALKKIAENPCLDPEVNSEIAQTALSAVGIKWELYR